MLSFLLILTLKNLTTMVWTNFYQTKVIKTPSQILNNDEKLS